MDKGGTNPTNPGGGGFNVADVERRIMNAKNPQELEQLEHQIANARGAPGAANLTAKLEAKRRELNATFGAGSGRQSGGAGEPEGYGAAPANQSPR